MNVKGQKINNLKASDRLGQIFAANRIEKELIFIINKELLPIKKREVNPTQSKTEKRMQAGHSCNRSLAVIRYCLYPGSTLLSGMIWNNLPNFSMTPLSHKAQADNNSAYFAGAL